MPAPTSSPSASEARALPTIVSKSPWMSAPIQNPKYAQITPATNSAPTAPARYRASSTIDPSDAAASPVPPSAIASSALPFISSAMSYPRLSAAALPSSRAAIRGRAWR